MLILLSPARNIRPFPASAIKPERPVFLREALQLAEVLKEYDPWQLESLLDLNPERAVEMMKCYREFEPDAPGTPALLSYYGAAFRNMNPMDFEQDDFDFAQKQLRILSAFYGILRPADGILPHRLGMKKEFRIDGQDLYAFWGRRIYEQVFPQEQAVVNLASLEYAKLIMPFLSPGDEVVRCRFLVQGPNGARGTVATIRAARGLMARYIIKNRITRPEGLKEFDMEGYRYIANQSTAREYVFLRMNQGWEPGERLEYPISGMLRKTSQQ